MNILLKLALACVLFSPLPAAAQTLETGRGVLCDTAEQAFRAAASRTAVEGCTVLTVAYVEEAVIGRTRLNGRTARVVKVTVFAVITDAGWNTVKPAIQYALIPVEGETDA